MAPIPSPDIFQEDFPGKEVANIQDVAGMTNVLARAVCTREGESMALLSGADLAHASQQPRLSVQPQGLLLLQDPF